MTYLDALVVKVRDGAHVRNKAAHIAVGVDMDGVKHVLGIWIANQLGTPIPLTGQTVGGNYIPSASGSGFAAPIWGDAMSMITVGAPYDDFVYQSGVEGGGVTSVPQPKPPKGPKGNHGNGGGGGNGCGNGGR